MSRKDKILNGNALYTFIAIIIGFVAGAVLLAVAGINPGVAYGKLLNGIRKALSELDGNKAMAELRANGELKLDIDGNEVVLSEGDLLIEEGFVREIISKIQTMRKEAGFEVMDKIQVYVKDNKVIEDIMKAHAEEIQAEVLAEKLLTDTAQGYVKSWNINSQEVTLGVEKMN